jgi:hypothetical protein
MGAAEGHEGWWRRKVWMEWERTHECAVGLVL